MPKGRKGNCMTKEMIEEMIRDKFDGLVIISQRNIVNEILKPEDYPIEEQDSVKKDIENLLTMITTALNESNEVSEKHTPYLGKDEAGNYVYFDAVLEHGKIKICINDLNLFCEKVPQTDGIRDTIYLECLCSKGCFPINYVGY